MYAFQVSLALSKARSDEERHELFTLLSMARQVDDREGAFHDTVDANRRVWGMPSLTPPRTMPKAALGLQDEFKRGQANLFRHMQTLGPSAILEFVEVELETANIFWDGLENPTTEAADRPLINALNQERSRFLAAIRAFRRRDANDLDSSPRR